MPRKKRGRGSSSARKPMKDSSATGESFSVVGIGASAGGLEAFTHMLGNLPANTGMAYALVQHLDPSRASSLTDILARTSSIPIVQASDGVRVERDRAYVIPPGASMTLVDGHLKVERRKSDRAPRPIDAFLQSLAEVQGSGAIGIVLSGTGSDGALGIEAIKEAGGITFAQDADSAAYGGMPEAAVATGCVDFVLPPAEIAAHLGRISKHPYLQKPTPEPPRAVADTLSKVLALLRARAGVDFAQYKRGTVQRRLVRRMVLRRIDSLADYVDVLRREPAEVDALSRDLLIGVTRFFRDAKAFTALSQTAFPRLVKNRRSGAPIRVWVPGCASGEEAYSIAVCLVEFLSDNATDSPIQIFGTDLNDEAIARARRGLYPFTIEKDVSAERLGRFFVRQEHGYRVAQRIRELCTFARHNVTRDPPFAHLDLISCRNLLIYLEPTLQAKLLAVFHYALNPGGILFLGTSESAGAGPALFSTVHKTHRFYARKPGVAHPLHLDATKLAEARTPTRPGTRRQIAAADLSMQGYKAGHSVGAVGQAKARRTRAGSRGKVRRLAKKTKVPAVGVLRQELDAAQREIQAVREEHESAMEELQASSEEIQSTNEELQSTNEELETAKEELESSNEELTTVNDELRDRNAELGRLNDDLNNVSTSIKVPVLIVTTDLRIRRFTAGAERLLNVIATDVGRPIGHIASNIDVPDLSQVIVRTLDTLTPSEHDVRDREGHWYSMVVRPYRTADQKIDGAVIAFHDIDARKIRAQTVDEARRYAEAIVQTVRTPLLVLDGACRVQTANRAFHEAFSTTESDVNGRSLFELSDHAWDLPPLRAALDRLSSKETTFDNLELDQTVSGSGPRTLLLSARRINFAGHREQLVLVSIEDISPQAEKRKLFEAASASAFESAPDEDAIAAAVARLVVPAFADWCIVDTRNRDGQLRRAAVVHRDPNHAVLARQIAAEAFPSSAFPIVKAVRTAEALLFEDVPAALVEAVVQSVEGTAKRIAVPPALRPGSMIVVPLFASGRVFGAITCIATGSGKRYDMSDLATAEELGRRVGLALERGVLTRDALDARKVADEARGEAVTARYAAEAANQAKSDFLAAMSHELRTPLNAVSGYTELLDMGVRGPVTDDQHTDLLRIKRSADHLLHLINDVLSFAKIEAGHVGVDVVDVPATEIVAEVEALTTMQLVAKGLRYQRERCDADIIVRADPERVTQVLVNLMANATKFTPAGGQISIDCGVGLSEGDEPLVHIRVRDTGVGIALEKLETIFDAFEQGRRRLSDPTQGVGLGLTISRSLARAMGGDVTVESTAGAGSTFTLTLPRAP
jgi:two-component system CheB/CheR fusion protein